MKLGGFTIVCCCCSGGGPVDVSDGGQLLDPTPANLTGKCPDDPSIGNSCSGPDVAEAGSSKLVESCISYLA